MREAQGKRDKVKGVCFALLALKVPTLRLLP